MLLDRDRHEGAAFDGGVVRDEHIGHAVDDADTGDDAATGDLVAVLAPSGQGRELEERGVVVGDHVDAVAHHDLAAGQVTLDRAFTAGPAVDRPLHALPQSVDKRAIGLTVRSEGS